MSIANKQIIIAAISSRTYVEAAVKAGFEVVAIDAFVDTDMQRCAKQCFQVDVQDNALDQDQLISILDSLSLDDFSGFCYGAGFEHNPTLLASIAKRLPVLGNAAACIEKCKAVEHFFPLCNQLHIPYPPVAVSAPQDAAGWLQKSSGHSGGGHVQWSAKVSSKIAGNVYYQQYQAGKTVSCLFLATDNGVQIIGFNEQWVDDNDAEPFRYGGAVSHVELSALARQRFTGYVGRLSKALSLIGLNSCDAICDGDEVYVLEVNPRLSATIALYAPQYHNIMAEHIAACQHDASAGLPELGVDNQHYAHQVIYAKQEIHLNNAIDWPSWVSDIPQSGTQFVAELPVCTVNAAANTAQQAIDLVKKRAVSLEHQLYN